MKIQEKIGEQIDFYCFLAFPRFRDCSYRQERKKLVKNEVLDVKKFADTAKNEEFQNPGLVTRSLIMVILIHPCSNDRRIAISSYPFYSSDHILMPEKNHRK